MNNKVSKIQIGMFLVLIMCSLYLGLSDIILLRKSGNEVLISMIVGSLIGIIPVLMYLKINSHLDALNIYEKNKVMFGKVIGNIINVLMIIIYIIMLVIALRAIAVFVTSKYLQNTPFYLITTLIVITCLIISFKGLETLSRVSQICFILSLIFMIIIETFLFQYIEIDNILPVFIGDCLTNVLNGAIYHAATTSLLTMLLLTISKSQIKDQEKYNKTIIIFYVIASLTLLIVMFFVISCLGYDMAKLFRYPEYILLKKIGISSSELHLENLLAFRWIFYMLALANISAYGITCGVKSMLKNEKLNKIIIIIICLVSMFIGKMAFGDIPHSIIIIKKYFVPFIALPMFVLLTIMFLRVITRKKES